MSINGDVNVDVARLSAQMEAGFSNLVRRLDEQTRDLSEIKQEVKRTNGRVTVLETVRDIASHPDKAALTVGGLGRYLAIVLATIAATVAVLQFLGMHQ